LAVFAAALPVVVGWIVAFVAGWFGLTTAIRAYLQARRANAEERKAALEDGAQT